MFKFNVKVFYVMGKALTGELSCPCDRSCYFASYDFPMCTCSFICLGQFVIGQCKTYVYLNIYSVWREKVPFCKQVDKTLLE